MTAADEAMARAARRTEVLEDRLTRDLDALGRRWVVGAARNVKRHAAMIRVLAIGMAAFLAAFGIARVIARHRRAAT